MPRMIIPGFTLRHARTVASCASSSVKSHVSSNKATPCKGRVVPTLLTSMFSCCNLDWEFRFGHISSIFLSMARRTRRGTDLVGWVSLDTSPRAATGFSGPLSGFINQLGQRPSIAPCTFTGSVSRRLQWKPCSRRHPRNSPGLQVETSHPSRLSP